jgi:hypothetical protein
MTKHRRRGSWLIKSGKLSSYGLQQFLSNQFSPIGFVKSMNFPWIDSCFCLTKSIRAFASQSRFACREHRKLNKKN